MSIEQRANIKFCFKLGKTFTETHQMMQQVYGSDCSSRATINEWFWRFKDGREYLTVHGEKNLGLNARELMSFTRGLLVVRMPQASLAMFTMTSCVQCTTSSLVLNAPTHLRKSLKSFGLVATLRCAKSVKLTTTYFQEIPRTFSVRFLAIAF